MAGIGIELNKIFEKKSVFNTLKGIGYSVIVTITPILVIIGNLLIMYQLLHFEVVDFYDRELFACSVLYVFIFSLLFSSPFGTVISRYIADKIFENKYDDILPCFYSGLALNMCFGCLFAIPFALHGIFAGGISPAYMFVTFCMFCSLSFVFYCMTFLSITKSYRKISAIFFAGMALALLVSLVMVYVLHIEVTRSMLTSLTIGFFFIAFVEFGYIKRYFSNNSGNYRELFHYMKLYKKLVFGNFFYTLALYCHNFIFWTTDMRMVLSNTYVCAQPYDMATCLAMFTNISCSVIFIVQIETKFHDYYKRYINSIIGGDLVSITTDKNRMFRVFSRLITYLVQLQFSVSVILFLLMYSLLPMFGFSGLVMQIYPGMCGAYFFLFVSYSLIVFLYYFDDLTGALTTSFVMFAATLIFSIIATKLPVIWYCVGCLLGSMAGWTYAYFRMRWLEKHFDEHMYCRGVILEYSSEPKPESCVYITPKGEKAEVETVPVPEKTVAK